jgi:hypothetical protein
LNQNMYVLWVPVANITRQFHAHFLNGLNIAVGLDF